VQGRTYDANGDNLTFADNMLVKGVAISDMVNKGVYMEAMNTSADFATMFEDVSLDNCGWYGRQGGVHDGQHGTGMDFNLKYGDYQNLLITDSQLVDCGLSNGNPTGSAISFKARDDSNYDDYTSPAATLANADMKNVDISWSDSTMTADAAVRIGEMLDDGSPSVGNATGQGPEVDIIDCTIAPVDETSTSVNGGGHEVLNLDTTPVDVAGGDVGDVYQPLVS